MANNHRARAVTLLQHYVSITMKASGRQVDNDTYVELEECVDAIIAAAREPELSAHAKAVASLQRGESEQLVANGEMIAGVSDLADVVGKVLARVEKAEKEIGALTRTLHDRTDHLA